MKARKLKKFVLPTLYVTVIGVLFMGIVFVGASFSSDKSNVPMAVNAIMDEVVPVMDEVEQEATDTSPMTITKPFTSDKVSISKSYYDMSDEEQKQQQSLVYYESTYLQNSGVLYSSTEVFDILATYDGTVTKVSTDEILGNVVEITHNSNLKTIYYSLGEVTVKLDEAVSAGTIIGKSGSNSLENETDNCLLFEVYYKGSSIDPEDFYNMTVEELQ